MAARIPKECVMTFYDIKNLFRKETQRFEASVPKAQAVAYAHAEDTGRLSEFLTLVHEHRGSDLVEQIRRRFPIQEGEKTVACGEWVVLK